MSVFQLMLIGPVKLKVSKNLIFDGRVTCIDRMEFDANGDIKPIVMTK